MSFYVWLISRNIGISELHILYSYALCLNTTTFLSRITAPVSIPINNQSSFLSVHMPTNIWHYPLMPNMGVKPYVIVLTRNSPVTEFEYLLICLLASLESFLFYKLFVHVLCLYSSFFWHSCIFHVDYQEFFVYSRYLSIVSFRIAQTFSQFVYGVLHHISFQKSYPTFMSQR